MSANTGAGHRASATGGTRATARDADATHLGEVASVLVRSGVSMQGPAQSSSAIPADVRGSGTSPDSALPGAQQRAIADSTAVWLLPSWQRTNIGATRAKDAR